MTILAKVSEEAVCDTFRFSNLQDIQMPAKNILHGIYRPIGKEREEIRQELVGSEEKT